MDAVEAWFGVEEYEDVAGAIIECLTNDFFEESLIEQNVESDDDVAHSSAAGDGPKTQPVPYHCPPPYSAVTGKFGDLDDVAERCNMGDVSYYLREAKLARMHEYRARKTKQTSIRRLI